jgi:GNAT superfamily N-acetyltransferase
MEPDLQLVLRSVAASQRLLGRYGPDGYVEERPGWVAAVLPSLTEASLVNGVVILDPDALPDALALMSAVYFNHGVRRWGVLLTPSSELRPQLHEAGLAREALPFAMAGRLSNMATGTHEGRETTQSPDFATVGRINDQAYGHVDDRMHDLIAGFPPEAGFTYGADFDGEIASVAVVSDHESDAAVSFVATLPWAQHQGLAGRILRTALADAKHRGRLTSTLIASHAGHRLYTALGYRDVGTLELWEHRDGGDRV